MAEKLQRYSVHITPKATLEGKYSAEICMKEMVRGIPSDPELRSCARPGQIIPLLMRLGFRGEDIGSVMSRFAHERAITLTVDIDPASLQREGFEGA